VGLKRCKEAELMRVGWVGSKTYVVRGAKRALAPLFIMSSPSPRVERGIQGVRLIKKSLCFLDQSIAYNL